MVVRRQEFPIYSIGINIFLPNSHEESQPPMSTIMKQYFSSISTIFFHFLWRNINGIEYINIVKKACYLINPLPPPNETWLEFGWNLE